MTNKNNYLQQKEAKSFALSGLKGKALSVQMTDIPSLSQAKSAIPNHCFNKSTRRSIGYLIQTTILQIVIVKIGLMIPISNGMIPLWTIYSIISGTIAMGFWVIAHECGHGAFSENRRLETIVGYILHSMLLVPYFSWQRSHAIHHRFTNHITNGETHVPLVINGNGITEQPGGEKELASLKALGRNKYGLVQLILHLIFGWPAYLLAGKTGGPTYGTSNHFWPIKPFSKKLWPSNWARKVWISDLGIGLVIICLLSWAAISGIGSVITLYIGPIIIVNVWLVVYTWLHHTDSDVPHLSNSDFSYMRGAFLSIDRPYGKILDFLHHNIGSTHVIHHILPSIPHYHAKEATLAIKNAFPKAYLYNPRPIHKALWHIATNCIAVKKEKGSYRYLWQNNN